ncbi:MAG: response regulator transcription factor [Coriobacteriia bacterium]|nr:response regulator transcription factor [Coriobacteriia bacterium]
MEKILIIEDDFAIRQSVEFALRRLDYEVKSLAEGTNALSTIEKFAPDLIILDIMLPGMDGFEITERVRETDPHTVILIVSALGESTDKVAGLTLGADDYIPKPFSLEELVARVKANLRRAGSESIPVDKLFEVGDVAINTGTRSVSVGGTAVELRPKEFDLLALIVAAAGDVCTRQEIAEKVWGYEHLTSSRTIDVHVRRLRLLVEDPSRYTFLKTVHGVGYQLSVEEKPKGNLR